jgi:hypothetical protein
MMRLVPLLLGVWFGALALPAAESVALRPWNDYRVIMWISGSAYRQADKVPLFYQRLREMGINTSMVSGGSDPRPALDNHFPYYVENIVNRGLCLKWNATVSDWEKFVTGWAKTRDAAALVRPYVLDDPEWRQWARGEMSAAARRHKDHQPLAYDIRDELSVTLSANPFDYDFSPLTLENFRAWLKAQYHDSLEALNRQWETRFAKWEEVKPFTTDQIKARMAANQALPSGPPDWQALQQLKFDLTNAFKAPTRWNISPWADFRTYMDVSLARALEDLRQAAHEVDPQTPVGIEGTQMPQAFGGYDLWRLSQVLDWVEPYDIGNAREIFGSFMPGRPILSTVFEKETNPARRRLWHLLLEGDRGCIIWWSEDCLDLSSPDYALTPKAKALAPVLREMTSPLAQLFLRAQREYDPILVHYSQASIQLDWLLESTVDGSTWLRRFSSFEADHNRLARVRNSWLKALQDLGYSPKFIATADLEKLPLQLPAMPPSVVVLPNSLAMTEQESRRLQLFMRGGTRDAPRILLTDGTPGFFDEHGKLRADNRFVSFFEPSTSEQRIWAGRAAGGSEVRNLPADIASYTKNRLAAKPDLSVAEWIEGSLKIKDQLVVSRQVTVPLEARAHIYRYRLDHARLLAFERNIDYHTSEDLKQAGGNEQLEKPAPVEARLADPAHVYDLRAEQYLGRTNRIAFTLDPWQPSLFALLPEKPGPGKILEQLAREKGK